MAGACFEEANFHSLVDSATTRDTPKLTRAAVCGLRTAIPRNASSSPNQKSTTTMENTYVLRIWHLPSSSTTSLSGMRCSRRCVRSTVTTLRTTTRIGRNTSTINSLWKKLMMKQLWIKKRISKDNLIKTTTRASFK